MPDPALSIVITNYNYGHLVAEAIDSVLDQEHPQTEVIVVDDGSTDSSLEVLRRYSGRTTQVRQAHDGMAAAFTAGFEASRGQWLLFLDADDALLPGSCARIMQAVHGRPGLARVQWQTREVDAYLQPTGALVPAQRPSEGDVRTTVERDGPLGVVNSHGCGTAWSREFLKSVFPIPRPDFDAHCDAYLATLACLAGESAVVEEPLSLYRVHGRNDYAGRSVAEHAHRTLNIYRHRCRLLSDRLGVEPARWLEGNGHYDWLVQLNGGCAELASAMPVGARYVLLDDDQWAAGRQLLEGRINVTFPAINGTYAGAPTEEVLAAEQLAAAVQDGVTHIAIARPAQWWLECYPRLAEYIRRVGTLIHQSALVSVHEVDREVIA